MFEPIALMTTAGIAALVWGLVEVAKRFGAPIEGRVTVAVALGAGVGLGALGLLWVAPPLGAREVAVALLTGLFGGATAIGVDVAGQATAGRAI